MNEAKAIETLGNIFHFETYTGENGDYELSSSYWNLKFDVSIRERLGGYITIVNRSAKGMANCRIESDEDENSIASTIMYFIGRVIMDVAWDKSFAYDGTNGILAWPYSCNFAYIKTLKQNMDMNPGELEYQYAGRRAGLTNSRKPIKSVYDTDTFSQVEKAVDDLQNELSGAGIKIEDVYDDYFEDVRCKVLSTENLNPIVIANMNDILQEYMKSHPNIAIETEVNDYFYGRNIYVLLADEYYIDSSMQGQERGIQAIMDEYGCSREEAIDIMNSEVTSGCHGKAKKKNKKEIKSSLVDEFEDSYCNASNDWPEEERNTYEDSFINDFAKDHGITYDETKKMLDELQDKWYKDADNAGIVDIYSSTRRNITNVNRIFG